MAVDLSALPAAEDDHHEYKSSTVTPEQLSKMIARAASGFWNSGGGVLVAGVDGSGLPDGGIPQMIGRQPLRDWADQAIHAVEPPAGYGIEVHSTHPSSRGFIGADRAVLVIEFPNSHMAPHMAPDGKYYIRAGAHTVPARAFVVEALWERRSNQQPKLVHMLRLNPDDPEILQLYVTNLSPAPAVNVSLVIEPLPEVWEGVGDPFPLTVPIVDRGTPIVLDLSSWTMAEKHIGDRACVHLTYGDLAGREYAYDATLYMRSYTPWRVGGNYRRDIVKALEKIERSLERISRDRSGSH